MALKQASFEGYTDAQAVSTTAVAPDDAFSTVTNTTGSITATATSPIAGSKSLRFGCPSDSSSSTATLDNTASASISSRFRIRRTGLFSVATHVVRVFNAAGGTLLAAIALDGAGKLVVFDTASAVQFTASAALTDSTDYDVQVLVTNGNTTTGTLTLNVYLKDSSTLISTMSTSLTAKNFGTATIVRLSFGKHSTGVTASPPVLLFDDIAFQDSSTTALSFPATSAPSTLVLSGTALDTQVALSWTLNTNGGAITSYALTRSTTAGGTYTSTTAQPAAGVLTFTDTGLTNGVTYYYRLTATNSAGTSPSSNTAGPYTPLVLAATVSVSPTSGTIPFTVTATIGSTGGTGTAKTYAVDWGDGGATAAQSSPSLTHSYTTVGTFTVTATVSNT